MCLCAYNEEAVIRDKIVNLLDLRRHTEGDLEILIYVDGASDRTADIVHEFDDDITAIISNERHGKTYGMNLLVRHTEASILVFTDATVMVEKDAINRLRDYFADDDIGCVTAHLRYVNADASATSEVGAAYWQFDEWTKRLESATGSAMGADGSLFAMRRDVHQPVPEDLIDDLYLSFHVLCSGKRVVQADDVVAYEPHATSVRDEYRRKIRISQQCINVHQELWPRIRKLSFWNIYKYLTHRYLRWTGGYLLLASALLIFAAIGQAFGSMVMLSVLGCGLIALTLGIFLELRPFTQIANVLVAFAGNSVGTWRAYMGRRLPTWELAASARPDSKTASGKRYLTPLQERDI
ncbi:MAG: glycosyltransferase [Pseudomonadota bacterium]